MNARRLLVLVVVGLLLVGLSATAQETVRPALDVKYLGQFFDDLIPTNFCARVTRGCESVVGVPLYFSGREICSGQSYTAGLSVSGDYPLVRTGGLGIGCAYETWPPGVYKVRAIARKPKGPRDLESVDGRKKEFVSDPVALTIVSPYWCGIFAGGKLPLDTFINQWGFETKNCWREATMGFIYQTDFCCVDLGPCEDTIRQVLLPPARRAELLLLDPKFHTKIKSCGDFVVWASGPCPNGDEPEVERILVKGYCEFSQQSYMLLNGNHEIPAQFEMKLVKAGKEKDKEQQFEITVFRIPTCIIYKASGTVQSGRVDFSLDVCED